MERSQLPGHVYRRQICYRVWLQTDDLDIMTQEFGGDELRASDSSSNSVTNTKVKCRLRAALQVCCQGKHFGPSKMHLKRWRQAEWHNLWHPQIAALVEQDVEINVDDL